MTNSTLQSILAVECGRVTTTAVLIEQTGDHYRLTATGQTGTTCPPPWNDITAGVTRAIRQIEKLTGRTLLAPAGWPITPQSSEQQGVDAFIIISSAGPPLRLALAGLMDGITLASARRAAAATYTAITNVLGLDAVSGRSATPVARSAEARIQAILQTKPDAILLTGGTDNGAVQPVIEMANVLAMALRVLAPVQQPHVLYAGNIALRPKIAEILGPVAGLTAVDNLRPTLDVENLAPAQLELERMYIQEKMFRLPGFQKLSNWTRYPAVPASRSFDKLIHYLSRHNALNVMGVNIGSGATVVSAHTGECHTITVGSDAGVGHSLASLVNAVPVQKFRRWLPFDLPPEELENRLLNKSLQPAGLPATFQALMVEHAVATEALRWVMAQARSGWPFQPSTGRGDIQWNLLVGAGRVLVRAPHPGHAALILLDGVEPWGVTSLALDISGTTNILGAVAAIEPVAAVEVAARDTFLNLGTVIAPIGHGSAGQPALRLKISMATPAAGAESPAEFEVPYGAIERIPLPPGQKAVIEIRPGRHFDIGLGQPGRGAVTEVEGGILGIIVDARGRPLRLPPDDARRQEQLALWLSKLDVPDAASRTNHQSQ